MWWEKPYWSILFHGHLFKSKLFLFSVEKESWQVQHFWPFFWQKKENLSPFFSQLLLSTNNENSKFLGEKKNFRISCSKKITFVIPLTSFVFFYWKPKYKTFELCVETTVILVNNLAHKNFCETATKKNEQKKKQQAAIFNKKKSEDNTKNVVL